ncbi:MAG: PH domain-containing protein [Acidobacteriaceae bacterium]
MSYIDKTLVPGEKVVYTTKLHWIVMLGHLFTCLIFLAGAGYLAYYLYDNRGALQPNTLHSLEVGLAALLVLALLVFFMGSLRRNATEMAVTTRRVVVKTGLTSRRTIEMLLNKIETIEVDEPTMGRMLGYGSITIIGTGGTSEPFHKIAHPLEFRSRVQQEIERLAPGDATPRPV